MATGTMSNRVMQLSMAASATAIALVCSAEPKTSAPASASLYVADVPAPLKADESGAATGTLRVCNKGDRDEPLQLAIGNFVAKSWDGSSATLYPAPALSVDPKTDTDAAKAADPLPAGLCTKVHLAATGLVDARLMLATLSQGTAPLATVSAFRPTTPFHVNVDGPNAAKLALSVNLANDGAPTAVEIPIVNADALAYDVDWLLELGDTVVASGREPMAPGRHARLLARFGGAAVQRLFSLRDSGTLSPNRKDGRLLLARHADGPMKSAKMDEKEIAVTASLGYWTSPVVQSIVNGMCVFLVLLLGVLASLGINFAMPMGRKKVAAKQALSALERSLNGQGSVIDSRTLSALHLELRRLWAALSAQPVYIPETETVLPAIEARIKALGQRIDITRDARSQLAALKGRHVLALQEADQVEALCLAALLIVEAAAPSDADLQKAQTSLTQATAIANAAAGTPTSEAVASLEKRRSELVDALASLTALPTEPQDTSAAQTDEKFTASARELWEELSCRLKRFNDFKCVAAPSRSQYIEDSGRVWVAERLWQYAQLVVDADTSKLYRDRLGRGQTLLSSLEPGPDWSPAAALQTLRQVLQNVSTDAIVAALTKEGAPKPRIVIDPPNPMAFQITDMRVKLSDPGLDSAEARKLIECRWTIDGKRQDANTFAIFAFFEPKGRWRSGFFSSGPPRFKVGATLNHGGKDFLVLDEQQVELTPNRDYFKGSTWLAVASFLITVFVVTIGLLTAAQKDLQTLDFFAGFIALLTLGFSADVVKRSLSKT